MGEQLGQAKRRHKSQSRTAAHSATSAEKRKYFRREESLGYLLRSTARTFTRAFQARIEHDGITIGMWYYLRALWEQDGVTQRELSQSVETMDSSTVSALAKMERLGLIYRSEDASDRRKRYIFLTEKGKNSRDKFLRHVVELQEFAVAAFAPGEEAALRKMLGKLRDRLRDDPLTGDQLRSRAGIAARAEAAPSRGRKRRKAH